MIFFFFPLSRNEGPSICFFNFSSDQTPLAQTTTMIRACTQITQPITWVSHSFGQLSSLICSPTWSFIPLPACSTETGRNPDTGESWVQAPLRGPAHNLMLPRKFTVVFFWAFVYLFQILCLPHKVTLLRVIRLHLQAIRKVSDTYLKSYFGMSGSTLLSLEILFMAFYGSNQTPIDFLKNWIRTSVAPAKTKQAKCSQKYAFRRAAIKPV